MKIIIDTNVVISGAFFGGFPRKVLDSVILGKIKAYASQPIFEEYQEIATEMIARKQGNTNQPLFDAFLRKIEFVETKSKVAVSRDPDDDKFIECAIDAKALYIVSGDNDLLVLGKYKNIEIVTAKDFCERYLK